MCEEDDPVREAGGVGGLYFQLVIMILLIKNEPTQSSVSLE